MYGLGTLIGDLRVRTQPKLPICHSSLSRQRPYTAQTWTQPNNTNLMNSNKEIHLPLIPTPEAGKYFDVVSFLSSSSGGVLIRNNGDKVTLSADHFRGKYVMVCCFDVPLVETVLFQALIDRSSELYWQGDDFELVMVAGMSSQPVTEDDFNGFFSRFPESCLTVPFEQRDSICKLLDLGCSPRYDGFQLLVLDKEGIVVPRYEEFQLRLINKHGIVVSPMNLLYAFLHYEVKDWHWEMRRTRTTRRTLGTFLRSRESSSPGVVYKLNPGGGPREEVAISDPKFDDKTVGVYMCCDASFLGDLVKIYKDCKEKKLDFNVVVVFILDDPTLHQKHMESLLLEDDACWEWWCFPYDQSVQHRLLDLTEHEWIDNVIVMGPLVKSFDTDAARTMDMFGIDAYPFSKQAAIKAFVKKLRSLRMESFLGSSQLFRGIDRDDVITVEGLRGKKIILQVDSLYVTEHLRRDEGGRDVEEKLGGLVPFYHKMKAAYPGGFEMVFIERRRSFDEDSEINREIQGKVPWYVCPYDETSNAWVVNLMIQLNYMTNHGFFGFDEDGWLRVILNRSRIAEYEDDLIRQFQLPYDTILDHGKEGVYMRYPDGDS